jgi:hypothetical protein
MLLPIFPLPIFLLPEGITRLRIFEAKYIKLVSIASKEQGFAIMACTQEHDVSDITWASWVEIINFSQGEDNVLVIDVKCKALINLMSLEKNDDGLLFGTASIKSHWHDVTHDNETKLFAEVLSKIIDTSPELTELYQTKHQEKARWAVSRWIELLPINLNEKQIFAEEFSFDTAKDFVRTVITNNSFDK